MRSRKPRNSDDLPNGFHSDEVKGPRHRNCRVVLKVAAFALAITWASSVYVNSASSSSDSSKGWSLRKFWDSSSSDGSKHSKSSKGEPKSKHHHHHSKHPSSRHDKKNKRKTNNSQHEQQPDELPECSSSPLEEKHAYPIYACDELEVSPGWAYRLVIGNVLSSCLPSSLVVENVESVFLFTVQFVLRLFYS